MRFLVLGASGGVGRWVVRLAAERGHEVTAVVRASSGYAPPPPGVVVRVGDVTDPALLDDAVAGRDGVLSCLGLRRAGRSPWAPLRSPPDLTARVARLLVPAMRRRGVRRLIAISAGGVGDSLARLGWPVRKLVAAGNVGVAYRDLAAMEAELEASGLDWLAVRPVTLVDGAPLGRARPAGRYGLASTVRRGDVAAWMLDAAERPGAFAERRVLLGA
ncbi:MAG TPA: NAD(P)H-binding protein [Gemmatimonadaceae bacterium]|nr:NAD(P)H-binding protein [Gemmatimonadaceae bacterium]